MVTQLTTALPLPSPASGFTYSFDQQAGAFVRSSQSFGPILAERAETIGKGKVFFGLTFQRSVFDRVDGLDFHRILSSVPFGTSGALERNLNLELSLNQFVAYGTYGVSDRLDVSLAIPLNAVRYAETVQDTVIGPILTSFPNAPRQFSFNQSSSATGLGDLNLQFKETLMRSSRATIALGIRLRLPTGDEVNALGAGAYGIQPFLAANVKFDRVSPHVNIGYQRNGKSILAGEILSNNKTRIPGAIPYAVGADIQLFRRFTLDLDLLGQEFIHPSRVFIENVSLPGGGTVGSIYFGRKSFNSVNGSTGFKLNPGGNLLIVFNLLFRLNNSGLRTKVTPLIGMSYTL